MMEHWRFHRKREREREEERKSSERTVVKSVTNHGTVRSSSVRAAAWSYSFNRSG